MAKVRDTFVTRTVSAGKGGTRVSRVKYEIVRRAMLAAVPRSAEGIAFRELPKAVGKRLSADERAKIGSLMWYSTVVKLDLESRGFLRRLEGVTPQRIRRVK